MEPNGDQPSGEAPGAWDAWDADIERVAEPEGVVESDPGAFAPLWAAQAAATPEDMAASDEPEADTPDTTWEADLWAEPEADEGPTEAAGAEPITEPEPEQAPADDPEPVEDADATIAPEAVAAAIAASRIGLETPPESPWPERVDPTEVLPTTWEPPPPPPPREGEGMEPRGGEIRTTLGATEPELDEEPAEDATTAEQAVPWLIGVILLLAGMVIVLLALIFAGDASLGGGAGTSPSPTVAALGPSGSGQPTAVASPTPRPSPSSSPSTSAEPSATAAPAAQYGNLEMVYQGRAEALEPIYLLRRDFEVEGEPAVVTQDANLDVRHFAWSADGTLGAALYANRLVGIDPGEAVRHLSDGVAAITFGDDPTTVYAVRVTEDGGNNVASILAVKQAGGEERELDRVTYPTPNPGDDAPLAEAQFLDDGGAIRLYWMHDDTLRLWILGGGSWVIDPVEGGATALEEHAQPVLWGPEGERRIGFAGNGSSTTIRMVDRSGDEMATASVTGRISHLRWSPRGDQVVFTVGRSTSGGGVVQNLYLWNLGRGENPAPVMITNTGAAFGAEWVGSQSRWEED